jgi:ribosomal protein S18 acetylase RimI-like enzyme
MSLELFFLRSSEQHIVNSMKKYAHTPEVLQEQNWSDFYGLTSKDLGLYALKDNKIQGAIWSREIDGIATLSLAVLPEFRGMKVATQMMEQFLLEAATLYERVNTPLYPQSEKFFKKFGFEKETQKMLSKKLEKKEIIRPSDGYDPTRWMD